MSEPTGDKTTTTPRHDEPKASANVPLTDLMAAPDTRAPAGNSAGKPSPDLEAEALRAAEKALAEGQKALAAARAHLGAEEAPPPANRRRELLLRGLLVFNVLAMIGVALLPVPKSGDATKAPSTGHTTGEHTNAPRFNEPWNRALAAAEARDFAQAVSILDEYLASRPRMAASEQISVLMALAHYSSRRNDFKMAQEYQRRADSIEKSHSLPEDLVATAKAAAESGDQEQLRRVWARFLLQQRQVPSWLYKHVAEAYLQLGDSYRVQANAAAEAERRRQLEETAAALRNEANGSEGPK